MSEKKDIELVVCCPNCATITYRTSITKHIRRCVKCGCKWEIKDDVYK